MNTDSRRKTIWITGASSGIGEALAIAFAAEGHRLILSAPSLTELDSVHEKCKQAGSEILLTALDLAKPETMDAAFDFVTGNHVSIDVLVNNGGISQRSLVIETPMEIDRKIMEIDYFGHVYLTKKVLPVMVNRQQGHIIVMSSLSGLFGFPQRSAYCAAKHALHGFFETLRAEHQNDNIHVTIVCPGRIRTNISLHALTAEGVPHGKMDKAQEQGLSAQATALRIMKAWKRKKKLVLIGKKEIYLAHIKRFLPFLFYRIVGRVNPN